MRFPSEDERYARTRIGHGSLLKSSIIEVRMRREAHRWSVSYAVPHLYIYTRIWECILWSLSPSPSRGVGGGGGGGGGGASTTDSSTGIIVVLPIVWY